ncbi:MAG: DNA polymerase III subunit gamma/tau [Bacillota bacterium]
MGYLALYRQWRPQNLGEVIGQEHITRTLRNALIAQRVSHAYLFCGPRGTGKTSTAKIFAKAVNCREINNGEPCNECPSCRRINGNSSMDVMEIDAASHRGIDEVRELREQVKFAAGEGRYKVYIIDEVHMLTTEAFNALLKTLEEPPAHVIFILATTEPHKIPLTILSRCQRFDFRRLGLPHIKAHLKHISLEGRLEIEETALALIARAAGGGMRDALGILDQCMAYSGNKISRQDVATVLGMVADHYLQETGEALATGDVTAVIRLLEQVLLEGKEIRPFLNDLIGYFRDLLIIKSTENPGELVQIPEDSLEAVEALARKYTWERLTQIIEILSQAEGELRWSMQPRIMAEIGLIKAARTGLEEPLSPQENKQVETSTPVQLAQRVQPQPPTQPLAHHARSDQPGGGVRLPEVLPEKPDKDLPTDANILIDVIINKWSEILEVVKKHKITASAFLIEAKPLRVDGRTLVLGFQPGYTFHKERTEQAENRTAVEKALWTTLNQELQLKCEMLPGKEGKAVSQEKAGRRADEDPLIRSAIDLFGGEIVQIKD